MSTQELLLPFSEISSHVTGEVLSEVLGVPLRTMMEDKRWVKPCDKQHQDDIYWYKSFRYEWIGPVQNFILNC